MSKENDRVNKERTSPDNKGNELKNKGLKIDKKNFQGFLAGIVVAAVVFGGILAGFNKDFLFGSMVSSDAISDDNFDERVLQSDRPVLVFFSAEWSGPSRLLFEPLNEISDELEGYIKVVNVNADVAYKTTAKYGIRSLPAMMIFNEGRLISAKTGAISKSQIMKWIMSCSLDWQFHDYNQSPEAINAPTYYFMFGKDATLDRDPAKNIDNCMSEILLLPYDFTLHNYIKCDGSSLNVSMNQGLYSLLGNKYGGTDQVFNLPNLEGKVPLAGLNYFICAVGSYPNGFDTPSIISGDLKYFYHEKVVQDLYTGEIKLAKDVDPSKYGSVLIPCDGRELKISEFTALYSLIGTKFGGDGIKTFKIPDMTDTKVPVEGAQYYIILNGIYPYSN